MMHANQLYMCLNTMLIFGKHIIDIITAIWVSSKQCHVAIILYTIAFFCHFIRASVCTGEFWWRSSSSNCMADRPIRPLFRNGNNICNGRYLYKRSLYHALIVLYTLCHMHMQMGYDGLFFWRNDYDDRNNRLKDNLMEMVWRPSPSLGPKSDLFTGILFYGYGPPPGFCYDVKCTDPPIQVASYI